MLVFLPSSLGIFAAVPCRTFLVINYCALVQPLLHAAIAVNRYQCFRVEPNKFMQKTLSTRRIVFSVACLMTPPLVVIAFYSTRTCAYSINGVGATSRDDKLVRTEVKEDRMLPNSFIVDRIMEEDNFSMPITRQKWTVLSETSHRTMVIFA